MTYVSAIIRHYPPTNFLGERYGVIELQTGVRKALFPRSYSASHAANLEMAFLAYADPMGVTPDNVTLHIVRMDDRDTMITGEV